MKRTIVLRDPMMAIDILHKVDNAVFSRELDDDGKALFVVTFHDEREPEREVEIQKEIAEWQASNSRIAEMAILRDNSRRRDLN